MHAIDGFDVLYHTSHENFINSAKGDGGIDDSYDDNATSPSPEDREQRMASLGLVTGKSSTVGTRHLFGHDTTTSSKHHTFSLFPSLQDCMDELDNIIQTIDKPPSRKLNPSSRKVRNDVRKQVLDPITSAMQLGILPQVLEKRKYWGPRINRESVQMNFEILTWLIRTCMSGKPVGTELCIGAFEMICKVLKSDELTIIDGAGEVRGNIFHIRDFVPILEIEFGLWIKQGPPPAETQSKGDINSIHNNNSFGLRHAFEVWSLIFGKGFVAWDGECGTNQQDELETLHHKMQQNNTQEFNCNQNHNEGLQQQQQQQCQNLKQKSLACDIQNVSPIPSFNNYTLQIALKIHSLKQTQNRTHNKNVNVATIEKNNSLQSWDQDGVYISVMTSHLIAILCRTCIDPLFHEGNR